MGAAVPPATEALLAPLVSVSRRYGADPDWVLAGGGNTSFKTADRLYVKASGFALGSIDASGFCAMDRSRLDAIWTRSYPANREEREDAALADLMAARLPGETKRPSVETLLHSFFPQAYVVHTHPAMVNGLTCGQNGEAAFRRLFSEEGIWVPFVDPGFILANAVREVFEAFRAGHGAAPSILFMQNHGLLVAGESPARIEAISAGIAARLAAEIAKTPGAEPDETAVPVDSEALAGFWTALESLAGTTCVAAHRADRMALRFAASTAAFEPLSRPFSPDHIVYAGHEYLRVDGTADLGTAWADYLDRNGAAPRIVLAKDLGAFALAAAGSAEKRTAAARAARTSLDLFVDSCKVAVFTAAFGGQRFMTPQAVAFIRNWEVEKYRSSISAP